MPDTIDPTKPIIKFTIRNTRKSYEVILSSPENKNVLRKTIAIIDVVMTNLNTSALFGNI